MLASTADTKTFLAMKHGGYYSSAAEGAEDVTMGAFDLVTRSLKIALSNEEGKTFRCADFGCADGGISLKMWTKVFGLVTQNRPNAEIELFYEDLPRAVP